MHFSLPRSWVWLALAASGFSPALCAMPKGRDAGQMYADLCANCHGKNLEGGKGGGLINREWKRGADDASLARSIRSGIPEWGMPGFANNVNEAETNALVAFIRETGTRKVDPTPTADLPLPDGSQRSEEHAYRIEAVAEGFDVPWSFCFLPDGRILVTERSGRLRVVESGTLRPEMIGGLPALVVGAEGGLMSVVAHPDFSHNSWIYLSFSDPGEGDTAMTKIVRARLNEWQLVEHETIFSIPREKYHQGYALFGGRLVFDGDYLFFSVGVRGLDEKVTTDAQDISIANGKIHRVLHDGKIPPDNPFATQPGALGS